MLSRFWRESCQNSVKNKDCVLNPVRVLSRISSGFCGDHRGILVEIPGGILGTFRWCIHEFLDDHFSIIFKRVVEYFWMVLNFTRKFNEVFLCKSRTCWHYTEISMKNFRGNLTRNILKAIIRNLQNRVII